MTTKRTEQDIIAEAIESHLTSRLLEGEAYSNAKHGRFFDGDDVSVKISPKASSQHLDDILDDPSQEVKLHALSHPNIQSHHIDKALNDKDPYIRAAALRRYSHVKPHHLDKAIRDKSPDVRREVVGHPAAEPHHIDKALDDKSSTVRLSAVRSHKAKQHHLEKALKDEHAEVRAAARKAVARKKLKSQVGDQATTVSESDDAVKSVVDFHRKKLKVN